MYYKQEVNVPASYFFQQLINSARAEVETYGGIQNEALELEGSSYTKYSGTNKEFVVEIKTVITNKTYQFVSKTTNRTYISTYMLTDLSEKLCEVTYKEVIDAQDNMLKLNDALVSRRKKKQIQYLFSTIEQQFQLGQ